MSVSATARPPPPRSTRCSRPCRARSLPGIGCALFGFGVFEKVDRAARTARNPSTGGTVQVPATSVPRFRAGQALKDAVSGGSSRPAARRSPETAAARADEPVKVKAAPAKGKAKDDGKKSKAKSESKSDSKAKGKKSKSK